MSKQIDKHGYKMVGLKKASGETQNYGHYDSRYDEVFYNRSTGEVWTVYQCSLGHNSWTAYHDPSIIKVCCTSCHMTMQAIADAIAQAITEAQYYAEA